MKYKDYDSVITFDEEAKLFHGEVINIRDVITFQGSSVDDLEKAFHQSVDDYLDFCDSRGELPEKPFSGKLIVRISPQLHREVSLKAKKESVSVNHLISEALTEYTTRKKE
ncbi:MAG: toxin-antitoxin system HicB family antitoxin [Chloroflexi bacterium HGW-Chloroflexi-5]|jgi:predicted HicB family RNase H-like nuclease|nr:MAG: toxin-antitoxin system HicB family antitoxin [Chloroflexi bacterium HGW-Chloroflexi-5]